MALLVDGINLQISGKSIKNFKTSHHTTLYTKRHAEKQHKPEIFKRLQKMRKHMQ